MNKRSLRNLALPVALALLLCLLSCRQQPLPLKIGFVGGLTGRVAGLGVAGRDAVLLAIEERNAAGGIGGRSLELVSRDDRQDEAIARKVTRELIDGDVVAIIGPMTSAVAVAMQPLINQAGLVTISPTVTANSFNGQDDYFFRTTMPLQVNARKLADEALRRGLKRFAVSVDTANAAYTEDWLETFRQFLEKGDGQIIHVERFRSGSEGGFLPMAGRIVGARPDALLMLSGAMDTALLAQQVRKLGSALPLFGTEWSVTSDVISFGGRAVEGLECFVTYDPSSGNPEHQRFLAAFERRFGYLPSFAAVLAYEAARFLFTALERDPARAHLKAALAGIGRFPGLQNEVTIDRFGDPDRETYLLVIRDGRFQTID